MINFINKLGNREKKIVLFSIILLFIFLISLAAINFINGYILASQNLSKAKSDYNYVLNRINKYQLAKTALPINQNLINSVIANSQLEENISELKVRENNNLIYVSFLSTNITDAITMSQLIANRTTSEIVKLNYTKKDNRIISEIIFN
jgi:predicted PurR-regulated permease PerM